MNATEPGETKENTEAYETEISALRAVFAALAPLDPVAREFVFRTVKDRLGIHLGGEAAKISAVASESRPELRAPHGSASHESAVEEMSPKQFMAERRPASDVQRIAALAYYLTHYRKQEHFKTGDLISLNMQAAEAPMGNAAQAVANATSISGYLAIAGGGKKQITALGEKVVKELPDQARVREVIAEFKGNKRPPRTATPTKNRRAS